MQPPPAFQEYAANKLADLSFQEMSLEERGLLCTIRFQLWVSRVLPSDPSRLARVLHLAQADVSRCLTPRLMHYLRIESDTLRCPELDEYREDLERRRLAQSKGGAKGGKKTQDNIRTARESSMAVQGDLKPLRVVSTSVGSSSLSSSEVQGMSEENKRWLEGYGEP